MTKKQKPRVLETTQKGEKIGNGALDVFKQPVRALEHQECQKQHWI